MRIIRISRYALAALLTFTALSASAAPVRYSYYGADSSTYTGSTWSPSTGNYVPTDVPANLGLTGWVELEGPLAANLNNADISNTLSSWEFGHFNGNTLMNSEDYQEMVDYFEGCYTACFNLTVSTDALGNISEWSFAVSQENMLSSEYSNISSRFSLTPSIPNGDSSSSRSSCHFGWFICTTNFTSTSVGSWSATVVPIPGAVWLFVSALGLIGWRSRRC